MILQKLSFTAWRQLCFGFLFIFFLSSPLQAQEVWDPLEPVNRGVFWFNDQVDTYLLEPAARGYTNLVPRPARKSVTNFFENLEYPIHFVGDVLQLKLDQAFFHTLRFAINSTVGIAGLFDPATAIDIPAHYEDVGVALGYWGVPEGPYLVLPLLGPSNLRDLLGVVTHSFIYPVSYVNYFKNISNAEKYATTGTGNILRTIDTRANLSEAIEAAKESSLDYYFFLQGAYHQRREGYIYDGDLPEEDFEDEFEDEEEIE